MVGTARRMNDNAATAMTCLRSWTTPDGDTDAVRPLLTDDMTFRGPLGATDGADAYVSGLKGLANAVDGANPTAVITNGDDVCIVYDLVVGDDRIPTAGWYQFREGRICAVRAFFDPRPFLR
jgi:hypothetical protein